MYKASVSPVWADWCQPCKVIKPHFEELAGKWTRPNTICFASIDFEALKPLASRYNVSSLPTIILFESGKETRRMKGVDLNALQDMTQRFNQIASSSWTGASLPRGYMDITDQVDLQGVECLNSLTPPRILFSDQKPSGVADSKGKGKETSKSEIDWVASDTDAQLMLFVPFQSNLKVHSIYITSFASRDEDEDDDEIPARPRRIEIYTNRSHNLGFDEAEDTPATQTIELTPESWDVTTNKAVIETRFVKFQNVSSLVLFVVDADRDAEKTRIDRIRIIGETGEKRAMGKLQKVGEDTE
jgi:thiol-disulfide isomerase/thioredoxin